MLAFRQPLGVGPRHCGVVLEDRGPFIGIGKYVMSSNGRKSPLKSFLSMRGRFLSATTPQTLLEAGIPRCPIRHTVRAGGGLRVPETLARGGLWRCDGCGTLSFGQIALPRAFQRLSLVALQRRTVRKPDSNGRNAERLEQGRRRRRKLSTCLPVAAPPPRSEPQCLLGRHCRHTAPVPATRRRQYPQSRTAPPKRRGRDRVARMESSRCCVSAEPRGNCLPPIGRTSGGGCQFRGRHDRASAVALQRSVPSLPTSLRHRPPLGLL